MRYHSNKLVNAEGKMWHIGIDENDVGKGVILPGDPARCEMVAKFFDNAELKAVSRGNPTYTGTYDGASVSVMSTGMGGMAVAVCVEELKHIGDKNLIRMGTCGGLQPGVEGNHIVICENFAVYDLLCQHSGVVHHILMGMHYIGSVSGCGICLFAAAFTGYRKGFDVPLCHII